MKEPGFGMRAGMGKGRCRGVFQPEDIAKHRRTKTTVVVFTFPLYLEAGRRGRAFLECSKVPVSPAAWGCSSVFQPVFQGSHTPCPLNWSHQASQRLCSLWLSINCSAEGGLMSTHRPSTFPPPQICRVVSWLENTSHCHPQTSPHSPTKAQLTSLLPTKLPPEQPMSALPA